MRRLHCEEHRASVRSSKCGLLVGLCKCVPHSHCPAPGCNFVARIWRSRRLAACARHATIAAREEAEHTLAAFRVALAAFQAQRRAIFLIPKDK